LKIRSAEFVGASTGPENMLGDGAPEVAFAGRSNVGKSSLLNRLVGRRIARTSSTPGRTQTVNWYRTEDGRWLVDLPGFGYAKASKTARQAWAQTVADYFARPAERRLLIHLVDSKVGATPLDVEAAGYFEALDLERLVVATKIDKVKRGQRARVESEIRRELGLGTETDVMPVSATSGEGVRELWKRIAEFFAR